MFRTRLGMLALAGMLLGAWTGPAQAQYHDQDEGFFLFLDAVFATPRDTDQVLATTQDLSDPQVVSRVVTDWGSEPAGRISGGYVWPSGDRVTVSYWRFDNDERTVADGPANGFTNFAIGPGIYVSYAGYYGTFGAPGSLDITSEIAADSIQVSWGRSRQMADGSLDLEWSLGLRYASFEETQAGLYDFFEADSVYFGYYSYTAAMGNEAEMTGLEAGVRGSYRLTDQLSLDAGLSLAWLDGEITSTSSLTPVGLCNTGDPACPFVGNDLPASTFAEKDKDRSGTIQEFDVRVVWHVADDRYRIWLGYERSDWRGPPADLTRNLAGGLVEARTRDDVVFSGFKVGVGFRF